MNIYQVWKADSRKILGTYTTLAAAEEKLTSILKNYIDIFGNENGTPGLILDKDGFLSIQLHGDYLCFIQREYVQEKL